MYIIFVTLCYVGNLMNYYCYMYIIWMLWLLLLYTGGCCLLDSYPITNSSFSLISFFSLLFFSSSSASSCVWLRWFLLMVFSRPANGFSSYFISSFSVTTELLAQNLVFYFRQTFLFPDTTELLVYFFSDARNFIFWFHQTFIFCLWEPHTQS